MTPEEKNACELAHLNENHDSLHAPVDGCHCCAREVERRSYRCFGDGKSTVKVRPDQE